MKTEDIKRMALAWKEVQEAAKKKLDPVGKADADIDNDGDTDKSDAYLHNRRKAVSAAIKGKSSKGTTKEVVTSESSESKLDSFLKGMKDGKLYPATKKRKPTQYVMKDKKDVQKEEVELDEVSTATLQRYKSAASKAMDRASDSAIDKMLGSKDSQSVDISKEKKTMDKRSKGVSLASNKLAKEEFEQIDELSKKTLGSYVKKAAGDAVTKAYRAGDVRDKDSGKNYMKALGRQIGISTATSKLAKEEVEELDELSKKTLGSYVKKASRNLAGREYKRGAEKDTSTSNLQKSYKRDMGIAKAVDKLTKEEVEQIDELKKSTLGSYVKKASTNQIGNTAAVLANKNDSETDRARKRMGNRMSGIAKATDRLTKEEAEIEEKKLTPKEIKAALGAAKAKPKDKVSLAKAPWDMKKESVQTEAATASISGRPGVASPRGEGLSPSAKKELARTTPMPDFVNEPKIDKKSYDAMRKSGPTAPYKAPGDKNIINKPLDITARASKKEDDGFKDA
jgi:hypothetical protein